MNEIFETKPTVNATNAGRYAHCPAGAYQAVEQVERGKQQHAFAENRTLAAYGITRTTEECRLDGEDLADAVWAGDEAIEALSELDASNVKAEHKIDKTAKADLIADTSAGEDGIVIIELKFTADARTALDPQMLVTAGAAWRKRRSTQTVMRIVVINGKDRTTDVETISAPAMDWITDHLVASWLADACADSPVQNCPTWCVGCRQRQSCMAYQSLRNQIVRDDCMKLKDEILATVKEAVEEVTEVEMMNQPQEPLIIHEDTIDDVEERELAEMGHPVHRVWRDGVSY